MVSMIDTVMQRGRIYYTGLSKWKNKAELDIVIGPYRLHMAQTKQQVLECFRLRYEVFCMEMAGNTKVNGIDFDRYDAFCDHLVIQHEPTGKIVGTYRMNFSGTAEGFYTASEFEMQSWLRRQSAPFIELGRACIHHEHRRGSVIGLLWRGIAEYMKQMNAELLIGCSSVKITDARSAALVFKYFELTDSLGAELFQPLPNFHMAEFDFWSGVFANGLSDDQLKEAEEKIPALLRSYIKAGAKVMSYPAYDEEFFCVDFVTVLNRKDLDSKLVRRFGT